MTASALGVGRFPAALIVGAFLTLAMFAALQALISSGHSAGVDGLTLRQARFIRIKPVERVERVERKVERPPPPGKPPAPPQAPTAEATNSVSQALSIGAAEAEVELDLASAMEGGGSSDGDILPIVKVAPVYPQRALQRGLEGWVLVEFTVTSAGSVKDVKVVDADPKGVFEEAAKEAALKFRYKPKVIAGEPIEVTGVQNLVRFELER